MPAVLVHGVPETTAIWDPLHRQLDRDDVVTPALPGFASPRPDGFGATMDEYAAWLIEQIEAIGEPVDLVGHDWGGGFTVRLVSLRPDLVRTWVTDAAGLADVEFEWHVFAKLWQTVGEGEAFWEQQLAMPVDERAGVFEAFGVPQDGATVLAGGVDETMAACILDLYRSATAVQDAWGADFIDVLPPGLTLVPELDPFLDADGARRAAARAGARIMELPGVGHWWMLQQPQEGARMLQEFWASV